MGELEIAAFISDFLNGLPILDPAKYFLFVFFDRFGPFQHLISHITGHNQHSVDVT